MASDCACQFSSAIHPSTSANALMRLCCERVPHPFEDGCNILGHVGSGGKPLPVGRTDIAGHRFSSSYPGVPGDASAIECWRPTFFKVEIST